MGREPSFVYYPEGTEDTLVGEFHFGSASDEGVLQPDKGIKLFLTDPPYNLGFDYGEVSDNKPEEEYHQMMEDVVDACYEAADDDAHMFLIHYPQDFAKMWPRLTKKWKFHQWITWAYPANFGHSTKKWTNASRTILWLTKGDPEFFGHRVVQPYRNPTDKRIKKLIHEEGKMGTNLYNWWQVNLCKNVSKDKKEYSNQIPESLLERIILSTTNLGDIIADPFSGTFSTSRAAMKLGRRAWGCDLNPDVVKWRPTLDEYIHNPEIPEQQFDRDYPLYKLQEAGLTEEQFEMVANFIIRNSTAEELSKAPGIGNRKAKELVYNLKRQSGISTLDDFFPVDKIDWKKIYAELELPQGNLTPLSKKNREEIYANYIKYPRGKNHDNAELVPAVNNDTKGQIHSIFYTYNDYEFGILAPGKEARTSWETMSYHRNKSKKRKMSNHNDALPIVTRRGGRKWEKNLEFEEIFQIFYDCHDKDKDGLLVLAALLFNMAYCLVHDEEKTDQGAPKLKIPLYTLSVLREKIGFVHHKDIGNIPIEIFVHFIDILATNEDAKVYALGLEEFKENGRVNTILTCVHVIAVIMGEANFIEFSAKMGRNNGMAPVTQKLAKSSIFSKIKNMF